MMNASSSPSAWLKHLADCEVCRKFRPGRSVTAWISGALEPVRNGWYERLFLDGVFRHWWDGRAWSSTPGGLAHWRQVGEYPCWRGLAEAPERKSSLPPKRSAK